MALPNVVSASWISISMSDESLHKDLQSFAVLGLFAEIAWWTREKMLAQSGVSSEAMANRPGIPHWLVPYSRFLFPCPIPVTEFELQVEKLGLTREQYVSSSELRRWCYHNRNRYYVPKWLLDEWEIEVDAIFSGVA